jgi:hypothetical protein
METQIETNVIQDALNELGASPQDNGTVEMIVRRPNHGEREILDEAKFSTETGLDGDNWLTRGSKNTEDGSAHPGMQIAIMNSRVIQAISQDKSRWSLAGDQLFLDLDLSAENLPVGQQIAIGSVILEVSEMPHNGCAKFTERFGSEATRFVNSKEGRANRRRGVNVRVVQGGILRIGDTVTKV